MADNLNRKCVKCGLSPQDDPNTKLHRFPKPGLTNVRRCEMWATYCFPDKLWSSVDFQRNLYSEHRMLCNKHFKESEFLNFEEKKLCKHAVPDMCDFDEEIDAQPMKKRCDDNIEISYDEHQDFSEFHYSIEPVPGLLVDITNENHQKLISPGTHKSIQKPQDPILFKKCRKHMKKLCYLHNRLKHKKRKEILNVLAENKSVQYLMKTLNSSFALMLQSRLRNVKRKYMGRKWTLEEKIKALKLYKRSATCYRILRRLWCIPAPSTLKSLLRQFPLNTGINDNVFVGLNKHVKRQFPSDNEYILMFDEIAIRKQEATYVLVFMVASIRKKIKLPVAFYLSSANVTSDRLASLILQVLNKCFGIGMSISATVCVMDEVNRRAFTMLGASKNHPYFNINNNEVVAIFDPPHLLKCFRNSFLKYNLKCITNITSGNTKGEGIAKWSHIQDFYNLDNNNANFVFAQTLRNDHLNPNTKQKRKVDLAAQVLSHSVAVGMFAKIAQGELPADATTTAEVISNVDKLFDSVNSDTSDLRRGKPHSTKMTRRSPHLKHFEAMITFFEKLEFVGCQSSPPSKDGWIWTLNGIIKLFKTLKQKHRIKSLATRRLQLESLENLFSTIQANCGAKSNLTTSQFIDELKIAMISNLARIESGNYYEEDL